MEQEKAFREPNVFKLGEIGKALKLKIINGQSYAQRLSKVMKANLEGLREEMAVLIETMEEEFRVLKRSMEGLEFQIREKASGV